MNGRPVSSCWRSNDPIAHIVGKRLEIAGLHPLHGGSRLDLK